MLSLFQKKEVVSIQYDNTNFFLLGSLKIFLPIAALALLVLIPVNVSGGTLL